MNFSASSRQAAIRRAERRQAPRRRGAMLVVALACLAIVMAIIGVMLQGALRARRQLHVERDLRQVELLLEAGLDRAALQLAGDDDYAGETWQIPASDLLGSGDGEVVIVAARSGDAEPWQVRVAAEYPVGTSASVRRTRTFLVQD
jgi:type II secretory pathway pseudopilin PulG